MKNLELKVREDTIPGELLKDVQVFEDENSRYKSIAVNFTFADGTKGYLMVTRIDRGKWNPVDDIESITIKTKSYENTTNA